jgi:hypothetical protein
MDWLAIEIFMLKTLLSGVCLLACSVNLTPVLAQLALPDLTIDGNRLGRSVIFETRRFNRHDCAVQEGCVDGTGKRKLMRFDVATPNIGSGDLVLGDPALNPALFTYSPCHQHYHFNGYASYELLVSPSSASPILRGRKQAFCLEDLDQWDPTAGPAFYTCSYQGISAGWSDIYSKYLDCQWLDITNVTPGDYWLRVTINPDQILIESDYTNNSATVPVTIPRTR